MGARRWPVTLSSRTRIPARSPPCPATGIAPTGRQITIPVCNVMEVRDGKLYAEREYMDMLHMMQQLGVVPAPATA